MTIQLAVLFSGGGRSVLNLLDSIENGDLDASITVAIASKAGISGIDRIVDRGIDVAIARAENEMPELGDLNTKAWLEEKRPDLICLCGYLRLLQLQPWMMGRVVNIHPALLPKFGGKGMYGMRVHEAVIDSGETESGCTVHFVDEEYDHGELIVQLRCPVESYDSASSLANKVFALECLAYPQALNKVANQLKV